MGQNLWTRSAVLSQEHVELLLHQFVVLSWNIGDWRSWCLKHFEFNLCCMSWLVQCVPSSGHRSLCKLVSVLFLTPISQTLLEGKQWASSDENVWSVGVSLPGTEEDRKRRNGSGEQMQKKPYLPVPFTAFLLPFLSSLPPPIASFPNGCEFFLICVTTTYHSLFIAHF